MSETRQRIQQHRQDIFHSVKDTFSSGVEEMKKTIIGTFMGTDYNHLPADPKIPQKLPKGQLPSELDKWEDTVSEMRRVA